MSELAKMLAGELYLGMDPELVSMRNRARRLMRDFNQSTEVEMEKRTLVLRDLLGTVADKITIEPPFFCDYGSHIHVGKDFYMNFGCTILDCAEVRIGDGVMCGPNVQLYTATHPLDAFERARGPELAKPITIGHRVWLGGGTIVCPGVTIGDNTTIGAGSVVTKSIPANVFAAGNPCRIVRKLSSN